jgi:alkylation response protein AidB-like acyl-CoA dehydrogenase
MHWPKDYGGGDFSPIERTIWEEEEGVYTRLSVIFQIGLNMCGTTLMRWGSEADRRRLLPPMITGEQIWCQLFSEPAAGSDVGGLRTRAVRAGDGSGDWIVNGQKIWTSGAQFSDYGLLFARTDPTVPKHKGLTMFYLDMRSPGVDVRPIRQLSGNREFNEVYFTDVRIPDSQRLGAEGQGWEVSITTLMNERLAAAWHNLTGFDDLFDYCCTLETPHGPAIEDRAVRGKLAHWAAANSGLAYTHMRLVSAMSTGADPGPEGSIGKLVCGRLAHETATYALDLQGQAGILVDPARAEAAARFQLALLRAPGIRIAGGTDEILANIIAERVLGLPGDIRVDKSVPFNQIPTGNR